MEIPYTVEVRRDTGLTNGKIGIWLFLASEVMLFGALFASYILIRTGAPTCPPGDTLLNGPVAAVNAFCWGPGAKLYKTNPVWFTNRVEHAGLFWHFVDLVWIFLFPTLYLL